MEAIKLVEKLNEEQCWALCICFNEVADGNNLSHYWKVILERLEEVLDIFKKLSTEIWEKNENIIFTQVDVNIWAIAERIESVLKLSEKIPNQITCNSIDYNKNHLVSLLNWTIFWWKLVMKFDFKSSRYHLLNNWASVKVSKGYMENLLKFFLKNIGKKIEWTVVSHNSITRGHTIHMGSMKAVIGNINKKIKPLWYRLVKFVEGDITYMQMLELLDESKQGILRFESRLWILILDKKSKKLSLEQGGAVQRSIGFWWNKAKLLLLLMNNKWKELKIDDVYRNIWGDAEIDLDWMIRKVKYILSELKSAFWILEDWLQDLILIEEIAKKKGDIGWYVFKWLA